MQTNINEQCSPENIYSCPQGYYCRILDDLTKTVCCPQIDQTMLLRSKTIISNPVASINSGSGNINNLNGDNIDYITSRTINSIDRTNQAINNISPAGSIDYFNTKFINSNEYHNSMVPIPGAKPNYGNGQIGIGIETSNFIRSSGAFVNSYQPMLKNAMIPESSIASNVPVFSGNSPVNPGIPKIDSLVGNTFGNAGISNGFNSAVQNLPPNAAIENIQKIRCLLPLASGTGTYNLIRYYFDTEASICRSFIYSGFDGNANNFETIQECRIICPGKKKII
ncbi:unnamed protein product [Onchocerca ochengi]|uniref:BPTI/Kunitz inhibitor domain-containing protein n=1 Tax=Onchocerca ochengi TaxID=42157 RepID=A0A182EWE4_ONCOC|nr:unnamed protein product [Onchocerca ochengi]